MRVLQQQMQSLHQQVQTLEGQRTQDAQTIVGLQQQAQTEQATIAGLQQQRTQDAQTIAGLQAHVQSMGTVETVVASIATAIQSGTGRSSQRPTLIDIKGLGKPTTFGDEGDKFVSWVRTTENFIIGNFGEEFRAVLSGSVDSEIKIVHDQGLVDAYSAVADLVAKSQAVHTMLVGLTTMESQDIVQGAGPGMGLEAWRRLHRRWDASTGKSRLALLNLINNPPQVKPGELHGALERWLAQIARFERRRDGQGNYGRVTDDQKMAALHLMVPNATRNHLTMQAGRLRSFDDHFNELQLIMEQQFGPKEVSIVDRQGSSPMDVDSFQKGKAKGGKGKGGQGRGGSGGGGGAASGGGTGAGKGSHSQFQGYCNNCGKWGRKATDCWQKSSGSAKGSGGKKDGGKKGGKGKRKGKAGSLEEDGGAQDEEQPEEESSGLGSFDSEFEPVGDASAMDELNTVAANGSALKMGSNEWVRLNVDSGASCTTFPKAWALEGLTGSGASYKTASGEMIDDLGGVKLKASTESGLLTSITGRVSGVHKTLASAAKIAGAGKDIWMTDTGGYVYPRASEVGKKIKSLLEKEVSSGSNWKNVIPLYQERGVYNMYLQLGSGSSLDSHDASSIDFGSLAKLPREEFIKRFSGLSAQDAYSYTVWAHSLGSQDQAWQKQRGQEKKEKQAAAAKAKQGQKKWTPKQQAGYESRPNGRPPPWV